MKAQFITDKKGKKIGVFLSIEEYERIMDELGKADEQMCILAYDKAIKEKAEFVDARKFFGALEKRRLKLRSNNKKQTKIVSVC